MIFHNEISQENNPNATARLYIQEDGTLFKQYFDFNALTQKNIDNLLVLASDPRLKAIKELALPIEIVREGGRVIGYTMPYYRGRTLLEHVGDEGVSFASKLSCFRQLARALARLPEGIFVGDLHMKNVIVDEHERIHLIDLDGFSVASAHLLSCPLSGIIQRDARFHRPKYMTAGEVTVSKNTDILCFYDAFLHFIIGGVYFTMYSHACLLDYLDYLERTAFPRELTDDVRVLFSDAPNRITLSALDRIDTGDAARYSFRSYAKQPPASHQP